MKSVLVNALVSTLSEGKAQKISTDGDDEVFRPGELGAAPGTDGKKLGLSTYSDLCSLASDLNQPDLIYKFLAIASNNSMWNSRKGAAFGFSVIASHAQDSLTPHLPTLLPRLFRFTFDPNPSTRAAMENIWKTLVPEPVVAMNSYFPQILADLCKAMVDRQWRVRESACLAFAEALRGRVWEDLRGKMTELWTICFREIDDVKESVRTAAAAAAKRLAKTTMTFCNASNVGERNSSEAVAEVLPCLIHKGLLSRVDDVKALSLGVMIDLAKDAGAALRPFVIEFMMVLLEALSGLESSQITYVATIVSKETGADRLDDARLAAAKSSPLSECVSQLVSHIDAENIAELVLKLVEMMKKGLGPATLSGCANLASQLASRYPHDLAPHVNKLLKTMITGAQNRSAPVRRDFSQALGQVIRCASAADVDMVIARCRKLYLNREKEEAQIASAAICRSIARQSPDVLSSVASAVLPLAFYGKHDTSSVVKQLWSSVWDENTPGTAGGVKLYASELITLAVVGFKDRSYDVKRQAAATVRAVAEFSYPDSIAPFADSLVEAIRESMIGRTWPGKEDIVEALSSITAACPAKFGGEGGESEVISIFELVARESSRSTVQYRRSVLRALKVLIIEFPAAAAASSVLTALTKVFDEQKSDDSEDDEKEKAAAREHLECYRAIGAQCIEEFFKGSKAIGKIVRGSAELLSKLVEFLKVGHWETRLYILKAVAELLLSTVGQKTILEPEILVQISSTISDAKQASLRLAAITAATSWVMVVARQPKGSEFKPLSASECLAKLKVTVEAHASDPNVAVDKAVAEFTATFEREFNEEQ